MNKRVAVLSLVFGLLLSVSANAGDEGLAREYMAASGFREGLVKLVKSSGVPDGQLAALDLSSVESAYTKSMARHLNNEEIKALIQAQAIPGYRSAMGKMSLVSVEMMSAAFKASQDAANKLGVKSSPVVPAKRPR